jgi:hypothetical protein
MLEFGSFFVAVVFTDVLSCRDVLLGVFRKGISFSAYWSSSFSFIWRCCTASLCATTPSGGRFLSGGSFSLEKSRRKYRSSPRAEPSSDFMQRCVQVVSAAVCRCAFRRLRHVIVARHTLFDSHGWLLGGAVALPLNNPARRQSTMPEKRFHCSVCKKAFRLEMAAKLHLQQVHGGEGTVEAGVGPGQPEDQTAQAPIGVFRNAPPQAPTVVTPVQPDLHERPARREKPAPKPLHQAEREVPPLVMERMLSVWDDIGLKRMGNQFVHSSMVMRVFAALPSESAEPLYGVISPEGENPFAGSGDVTSAGDSSDASGVAEANVYHLDMADAFAMATTTSFGPCRPAKCPNPFLIKYTREASKTTARSDAAEQQAAPVTPFGQLPMFGQLPSQSAPPQETPETATVATTTTTTTTVTAESSGTLVSSPFASGVDASPFAGSVNSPFAGGGYSPFASAEETPSAAADTVDAAAAAVTSTGELGAPPATPSPFLSAAAGANVSTSPFAAAASPFAASPFVSADAAVAGVNFTNTDASFAAATGAHPFHADVPAAAAAAQEPAAHVCSLCEKRFATHEGLRMHSKAKHSLDLPKEHSRRKRQSAPDLPAYIPSPVDLAMTSPFGLSSQATSWTDVELTPFAQSVSNITIAGKIVDTEVSQDGSTLLTVHVRDTNTSNSEMLTIRCSAEAMKAISKPFRRGDSVFACGSLRLLPIVDEKTNRTYASPVVHVTSPTGVVAKLNVM